MPGRAAHAGASEECRRWRVQAMFGALYASQLDHFEPAGFWEAFKDYDGQAVNLREHQDAVEFFQRLQDQAPARRASARRRPRAAHCAQECRAARPHSAALRRCKESGGGGRAVG